MNDSPARVALVTGAAKRVGRATALELAGAGFDIALHYHTSTEAAKATAEDIRSRGRRVALVQADLSDNEQREGVVEEAVRALGRLDVLVNNASMFETEGADTLDTFDADLWRKMFEVNLLGPVDLCHRAAPHLRASDGVIVNFLDIAVERPWPSHLAYVCSKGALATATRAMAKALAPDVRVCGVAPGIAEFPESYDEETRERLIRQVPLGRSGCPEEMAKAVRFLVESGSYVTGHVLSVDGGRSVV